MNKSPGVLGRELGPVSCTWARRSCRPGRRGGPDACPEPWRTRGGRGQDRRE